MSDAVYHPILLAPKTSRSPTSSWLPRAHGALSAILRPQVHAWARSLLRPTQTPWYDAAQTVCAPSDNPLSHGLYKYEDLLNTEPKFVPQRPGELLVADITYVAYQDGFAYLSLLTDAYSRCIVGYCLHPTL